MDCGVIGTTAVLYCDCEEWRMWWGHVFQVHFVHSAAIYHVLPWKTGSNHHAGLTVTEIALSHLHLWALKVSILQLQQQALEHQCAYALTIAVLFRLFCHYNRHFAGAYCDYIFRFLYLQRGLRWGHIKRIVTPTFCHLTEKWTSVDSSG